MLLESLTTSRAEFERGTGWTLKPEGACKGDVCVPVGGAVSGDRVDVAAIARAMGLPLVEAKGYGLWALGPESIGSRALTSAEAPDFELPDVDGRPFRLSSLRGRKVLVYAWAPY
jgi:hypothetical protein